MSWLLASRSLPAPVSRRAAPCAPSREPCPDRILDDIGAAFGMGAVGGGIWHFGKGVYNSPRGLQNRALGGFSVRAAWPMSPGRTGCSWRVATLLGSFVATLLMRRWLPLFLSLAAQTMRFQAPNLGGSFAVWGGLFSAFDCTLVAVRKKVCAVVVQSTRKPRSDALTLCRRTRGMPSRQAR